MTPWRNFIIIRERKQSNGRRFYDAIAITLVPSLVLDFHDLPLDSHPGQLCR